MTTEEFAASRFVVFSRENIRSKSVYTFAVNWPTVSQECRSIAKSRIPWRRLFKVAKSPLLKYRSIALAKSTEFWTKYKSCRSLDYVILERAHIRRQNGQAKAVPQEQDAALIDISIGQYQNVGRFEVNLGFFIGDVFRSE